MRESLDLGVTGDRIRELRDERGMSQRFLAERVGVSKGYIALFESGRRPPSAEVCVKVAEFFGIDADELLALRFIETGHLPGSAALTVDRAREIIRRLREED